MNKRVPGILAAMLWSCGLWVTLSPCSAAAQTQETVSRTKTTVYVAAYGGIAFPESLKNVQGNGTLSGSQFSDRSLDPSAILGLKAGVTPSPDVTWFGLEAEVFYASPRAKAQNGFSSANNGITTLALNWILRYPGTYFQPYVGVGPSIVWASSYQAGGTTSGIGLNLLVGARMALGERTFLFAEYKHNRVGLDFSNESFDYRLHAVVGGIGMNF